MTINNLCLKNNYYNNLTYALETLSLTQTFPEFMQHLRNYDEKISFDQFLLNVFQQV